MNIFKKYSKWAAAFIFAVAVITVYKTFDNLSNITKVIGTVLSAAAPFFGGFIIAYLLNLPASRIKNLLLKINVNYFQKHAGGLSILLTYLIAVGIVVWSLCSLIPLLYRNLLDLYTNLPTYLDVAIRYISNLELVQKLSNNQSLASDLHNSVYSIFNKIDISELGKYAQGVFNITSGLVSAFIAVIASIYMLLDKDRISVSLFNLIKTLLGKEKAVRIKAYALDINKIFTDFLYSRLICSIIMAIVCSLALSLLKVKYAVVLGIFIGAMDMIPYFGSIISSVLAVIITIITGGFFKAVYTGITLLVLQQLDGNLLAPKIMESSLEIRPLWIIFAVSVGGTLFGFMGMLLSVPILAILRSISSELLTDIRSGKQSKASERCADE